MTIGKKLHTPSANSERAKNRENRLSGQDHPKADLTDAEVELIRQLHEVEGWGYRRLSKKFEKHRSTIRDICNYRRR